MPWLKQAFIWSKATNNEVIPLPVEGAEKEVPIIVISEGDRTRLEETTMSKLPPQIDMEVNVNDPLSKGKQPVFGIVSETSFFVLH